MHSLLGYVDAVRSGATSCHEFASRIMEEIGRREGDLHAYLSLNGSLLEEAAEIDRRLKNHEKVGAFCGAPVSVKDNICVRGMPATCASRMLSDYKSPYDATAVSRLRGEDALITGKTNLDEFAMGLSTEFGSFGPSRNPWDKKRVPGGSSGGSAAAVAASECLASLGSDTGGSVRNPASFCSVVGFKPTYGLLSRYGLISYSNSIEQIGPICSTVSDVAFMLNHIAGRDPNDDTTIDAPDTDYLGKIDDGVDGKKFCVITQMSGDGVAPEVESAMRGALSALEGLGASIHETRIEMVEYAVAAYYTITATEAGSNLARYDNIRYGYGMPQEGYEYNAYISRARSRFGPEVTRRIILGGFVPSAGQAGRYYLKALKVRNRLVRELGTAFADADYIISPTVPVLPFEFGEKIDDPVALFLIDFNTVTANLAGIPAVSVPYAVSGGLPIGMQIMAPAGEDADLLCAARALEGTVSLPEVPA